MGSVVTLPVLGGVLEFKGAPEIFLVILETTLKLILAALLKAAGIPDMVGSEGLKDC